MLRLAFRPTLLTALTALALWGVSCGGAAASTAPLLLAQIRPASVTLTLGQSQTFTAALSGGAANTTPTLAWTASGGTIAGSGSSGAFVAGTTPGDYTVTLAATGAPLATASITIVATPTPVPTPTPTPTPIPTPAPASTPLFSASGARWLYSAATGSGLNISNMLSGVTIGINTHDGGFDYPVQTTDGTHGCTNFTDTLQYAYTDHICVANPSAGYAPSVGGWGADDGHLVVVNTATGDYYDFWKLYVNGSGQPTSTNVGRIVSGNLATSNGLPGTTAADITGLAGDILPGELDCSACLQHALNAVVPGTMNSNQVGIQAPADHTDGSVAGGVFREGAKLVFDPSIDVDSLSVSTAVKALMKALQQYGAVITDQTGGDGISFYSALASQPDLTGIAQIEQHLFIYY